MTVIPLGQASPPGSSNQPGNGAGHAIVPLFGLAPGGVCRAGRLPDSRWALAPPFHPCHDPATLLPPCNLLYTDLDVARFAFDGKSSRCKSGRRVTGSFGGLLSVALSVGSRRPGVTWHPALRSPDFPRRSDERRDCPADSTGKYSRALPRSAPQRVKSPAALASEG